MIQTYIQPSAHLQDYIRHYLLLHFRFTQHNPAPVKPFPASPNQGIAFYPRGYLTEYNIETGIATLRPRTVIYGQQVSRFNLQLCHNEYILFDVRLQPGINKAVPD